jgi:hypothetical protein
MTQPRDPIEDWLGVDVELLPPRPGGFERVQRAARHRKAMRAAGAAAGAAFVVAAAVITPQLAGSLRHGSGPAARVTSGTTPPSPRRASPTPQAGPSLTSTTGGAPAPNFRPTSVTFVGQTTGAVIGRGGTVAGTLDYGRTWHRMGMAPAAVSQIRFLNTKNGWAFDPALYATHDGGADWNFVIVPGNVIDLAAVGQRAFAVVASGSGTFALYSARSTTDTWRRVPGTISNTKEHPGGLQLTGTYGYLVAAGSLLAGPVTGGAWRRIPDSATTPACLRRPGLALLAPEPSGPVFVACGARPGAHAVYSSADGGVTWQLLGTVVTSGSPKSFAVAPGSGYLVLATTRSLYVSVNGTSWKPATVAGGVPLGGFRFVGMTTQFRGVAVPVKADLHEIFTTTDGGLTWQPWQIQ